MNPRPLPCQGSALPTELRAYSHVFRRMFSYRVKGAFYPISRPFIATLTKLLSKNARALTACPAFPAQPTHFCVPKLCATFDRATHRHEVIGSFEKGGKEEVFPCSFSSGWQLAQIVDEEDAAGLTATFRTLVVSRWVLH